MRHALRRSKCTQEEERTENLHNGYEDEVDDMKVVNLCLKICLVHKNHTSSVNGDEDAGDGDADDEGPEGDDEDPTFPISKDTIEDDVAVE